MERNTTTTTQHRLPQHLNCPQTGPALRRLVGMEAAPMYGTTVIVT